MEISTNANIYYPVYCAWCREIISYTTVEHSSGICQSCAQKIRSQAAQTANRLAAKKNQHHTASQKKVVGL